MNKTMLMFTVLLLSMTLPVLAHPQQTESLGDFARQMREQREREARKATKVYTNDNLPVATFGEAVSQSPLPGKTSSAEGSASKPAAAATEQETGSKPPESPEGKARTRDYWQGRFKAARQDLAAAKDRQHLAEDELNLLQIQQVRELDPSLKSDLDAKVQSKQTEVDADKAATSAAEKALEDLQKEFDESGAPKEWSVAPENLVG